MTRIQKRSLPAPAICPFVQCVYSVGTLCFDPRTAKGNSDAHCFNMSNKDLLLKIRAHGDPQDTTAGDIQAPCGIQIREGQVWLDDFFVHFTVKGFHGLLVVVKKGNGKLLDVSPELFTNKRGGYQLVEAPK